MSKIPDYILCKNPEEARQVLEKIERESDLRRYSKQLPTENQDVFRSDYYPEMVIQVADTMHFCSKKHFERIEGITNFTKAEDYLLSDETKIRLENLDNKLDKLINDMTNKTWETLSVGDILLDGCEEKKVVGVCGEVVFLKMPDNYNRQITYDLKENFIARGLKIKGASEEKPSIDEVIAKLEKLLSGRIDFGLNPFDKTISEAIEMLKKLK